MDTCTVVIYIHVLDMCDQFFMIKLTKNGLGIPIVGLLPI